MDNFDQFEMNGGEKLKGIVKKDRKFYVDNFDQFHMNSVETLKGIVKKDRTFMWPILICM